LWTLQPFAVGYVRLGHGQKLPLPQQAQQPIELELLLLTGNMLGQGLKEYVSCDRKLQVRLTAAW
jgi:hypothetical protein